MSLRTLGQAALASLAVGASSAFGWLILLDKLFS